MCRYPHLSCELLTCEVEAIVNSLSESEKLLGMLWAFLDKEEALNPLLGRYSFFNLVVQVEQFFNLNMYSMYTVHDVLCI